MNCIHVSFHERYIIRATSGLFYGANQATFSLGLTGADQLIHRCDCLIHQYILVMVSIIQGITFEPATIREISLTRNKVCTPSANLKPTESS